MYLLDTNVISEPARAHPERSVIDWLATADEDSSYLSVITIGEMRSGIERLAKSQARHRLEQWRERVIERFEGSILPIDIDVADAYGRLVARGRASGRPGNPPDLLIAATALWHGLT